MKFNEKFDESKSACRDAKYRYPYNIYQLNNYFRLQVGELEF